MWTLSGRREGARRERHSEKGTSEFFFSPRIQLHLASLIVRTVAMRWKAGPVADSLLDRPKHQCRHFGARSGALQHRQYQDHQSANNLHVEPRP
jgi:hypothetical protein